MLKAVFSRWLSYAIVVTIMLQCSPLIGSMMTGMLGRFTALADSIVCYDGGSIQVDGHGAENLLNDLAAKSDAFTSALEQAAKEVLDFAEVAGEHDANEGDLGVISDFAG